MELYLKFLLVLSIFLVWGNLDVGVCAKRLSSRQTDRDTNDDDDNDSSSSSSSSTETVASTVKSKLTDGRPKRFGISSSSSSLDDPISSSQNVNPTIAGGAYQNPYLLQQQSGLYAGAGGQNDQLGQIGQIGQLGQLGQLGQFGGLQNQYLGGGGSNNFQNQYLQLLLQQQQQQQQQQQLGQGQVGGLGGLYQGQNLYSGLGGVGGAGGGLGNGGLYSSLQYLNQGQGGLGGVNPYLLGGRGGQYLGGNYLAQNLLNPYNSINPYSTFPFSSRFGVGRANNRLNSQSSSSSNNDE